jgi:hypothetical protein
LPLSVRHLCPTGQASRGNLTVESEVANSQGGFYRAELHDFSLARLRVVRTGQKNYRIISSVPYFSLETEVHRFLNKANHAGYKGYRFNAGFALLIANTT